MLGSPTHVDVLGPPTHVDMSVAVKPMCVGGLPVMHHEMTVECEILCTN